MSLRTIQQTGFVSASSPNVPNTSIYNPIGDVACRRSAVVPAADPNTISLRELDASVTSTAGSIAALQSWAIWILSAPQVAVDGAQVVEFNTALPGSDVATITNNGSGEFTVAETGVYEMFYSIINNVTGDTWAANSDFVGRVYEGPAASPTFVYSEVRQYPPVAEPSFLTSSFITPITAGTQFCVWYVQPTVTGTLELLGTTPGERFCQFSWRRIA